MTGENNKSELSFSVSIFGWKQICWYLPHVIFPDVSSPWTSNYQTLETGLRKVQTKMVQMSRNCKM